MSEEKQTKDEILIFLWNVIFFLLKIKLSIYWHWARIFFNRNENALNSIDIINPTNSLQKTNDQSQPMTLNTFVLNIKYLSHVNNSCWHFNIYEQDKF